MKINYLPAFSHKVDIKIQRIQLYKLGLAKCKFAIKFPNPLLSVLENLHLRALIVGGTICNEIWGECNKGLIKRSQISLSHSVKVKI